MLSIIPTKIYETKFGFIDKVTNTAMSIFYEQEVKAGRAIYVNKAYKKLKLALEGDDYLMSQCIKLAIERGHIVKKEGK